MRRLIKLQRQLKAEQSKFDDPKYAKQIPEIAQTCARLRNEIRNEKQREQRGAA